MYTNENDLIRLGIEPTLARQFGDQINFLKYTNPVTSRRLPRIRPATNMQSGETWTVSSGAPTGTIAPDTSDYVVGTQSLKATTAGGGVAAIFRSPVITAHDFTNRNALVKIKIDNVAAVSQLWVVGTSNAFTDFYTWKISDDITQIREGEWEDIGLSFSPRVCVATGSPNRAALNQWQIRVTDKGGGTSVVAHFNQIASIEQPSSGAVCIVFDDGWLNVFQNAKPIMDAAGIVGTIGVIGNLVDKSGSHMNSQELMQLQNVNLWELADHTWNHDPLATYTPAMMDEDFQKSRYGLTQLGATRGLFQLIYPQGSYDDEVIQTTKQYYGYGHSTASYTELLPPLRPYATRCYLVLNTSNETDMIAAAQGAYDQKSLEIFRFHQIVTANANASTQFLQSKFQTFITGISSIGVPILTLSDALNGTT